LAFPRRATDKMMNLAFRVSKGKPLSVLCLGAHSDDIEIGCGGTVLRLAKEFKEAAFYWVVFSSDAKRRREAEESAGAFLRGAGKKTVVVEGFRDGFFPYIGGEIKEYFEDLKAKVVPDLVFTHCRHDLHQDHRLLSDLTWNTFRNHMVLEYEIPKYDGDLGAPNTFFPLDKQTCDLKISHLMKYFRSQRGNHWFTRRTFQSLLSIRGIESNAPQGFAEAFYSRKMVF
jgi:LmbE family N-acetylglucosaminyl deacetylase